MKIKDGKAIVRVSSHRARQRLERALGRLPQGYFKFSSPGEWREVTLDELGKLGGIKGITQSRWDDKLLGYWL